MGILDIIKRKSFDVREEHSSKTYTVAVTPSNDVIEQVIKVPDPISPKAPTLITKDQLRMGLGITNERADYWDDFLNEAMSLYGINTKARIAAFMAQIGHESGRLKYVQEIWGPTAAQKRYEGRRDLGNIYKGDGSRFRGHGLVQVTGRHNHRRATQRLRAKFPKMGVPDFEAEPTKLALPRWAALSAADFWDSIGGNSLADAGQFKTLTKRINGGLNGYKDRLNLLASMRKTLA